MGFVKFSPKEYGGVMDIEDLYFMLKENLDISEDDLDELTWTLWEGLCG